MMAMLKMGFWASFAAGVLAGGEVVSVGMVWSEIWGLVTAGVVLSGRVEMRPKGENARHL